MKRKGISLKQKAEIIKSEVKDIGSFTVPEVQSILEEKKSTVYWTLWNLADMGFIKRIGKGLYSFHKKETKVQPIPSKLAKKNWDILIQSGYQFFISGLDILSIFMEHVPENFPVVVFIDKYSFDEVLDLLSKSNINALTIKQYGSFSKF